MERRFRWGAWVVVAAWTLVAGGCRPASREAPARAPVSRAPVSATKRAPTGEKLTPLAGGQYYANLQHSFGIRFPTGWVVREGQFGTIVMGLQKPQPGETFALNVNVVAEPLPAGVTARQVSAAATKTLGEVMTNFKRLEEHYGRINGREAAWIVSTYSSGKVSVQALAVMVLGHSKVFTITCSATPAQFKAVRATFEGVAGSFKVD